MELLDGGATVPFIARYRKEATGLLDDTPRYCAPWRSGCATCASWTSGGPLLLESIRGQGKLDEELEASIRAADTKARVEDIYLPYNPKRRTKAQIAREAGLAPFADGLLGDPIIDPRAVAAGSST